LSCSSRLLPLFSYIMPKLVEVRISSLFVCLVLIQFQFAGAYISQTELEARRDFYNKR
jgi:hypothetical protein